MARFQAGRDGGADVLLPGRREPANPATVERGTRGGIVRATAGEDLLPDLKPAGEADPGPSGRPVRGTSAGPFTFAWWQIALLIVAFSVLSALFFVYFYREARAAAIAGLQEEQKLHARQAARGIEDFFQTWEASLRALSRIDEIVACTPAGRHEMLLFLEAHAGQIRTISRVDERGIMLASYPHTASEGADISGQKHFAALRQRLRPVVSDVFRTVQGFDAVALHVPVFRGEEFKGSIAVVINFETLASRYFDVIRVGGSGRAWVVSRDGTILYSPTPSFVGKSAFAAFQASPTLLAVTREMVRGREGASSYTDETLRGVGTPGLERFVAYLPVHLEETFWSVAVSSSEREILAGLNALRNRLALLFGFFYLSGMALAMVAVKAWTIVHEREERAAMQEAVRSGERLRTVMYGAVRDILFYLAVDGDGRYRFLTVNSAFLAATGLDEASVAGRSVEEVIPEPALSTVREKYAEAIATRRTVTWDEVSEYPSGHRHGEVSITPIFDSSGACTNLFGTVHDVTDRKLAEAELIAASERLREAHELASLGSWSLDLATGALTWSEEALRVLELGKAPEGRFEEVVRASAHPDDLEAVLAAFAITVPDGRRHEIDFRVVLVDGRVKWVKARWRTEPDAAGRPRRVQGTLQDVTEHMLALEARDLARAKEAAEAANREKSAFLAGMSHEIRTPMNAILGFTQLLLGDPGLSARHREQVGTIYRSGEYLLGLINDVLEMSKIEAGHVTVRPTETDLAVLLADVESMVGYRARSKGLSLVIERADDLPGHVVTDERRLRQILLNLVGNAVKFTETGGVTVRVRTEAEVGGALRLVVEVEDTGPGISEEELPRLFGRYEQARAGREKGGGTGLGLALSRGFARLMGGDVTAQSRPGEGSTFHLTLPIAAASAPPDSGAVESPRPARLAPGESRRRILVAEDVAENQEIFARMLGRVGFEVRLASDGAEAVSLAASWRPHLVLMDLRMEGMDGIEATRAIRAAEAGERLPIIAVTANAFEENRAEAREAGADDFLAKPFREADLLRKVAGALGIAYVVEASEGGPEGGDPGPLPGFRSIPPETRAALRSAVERCDLDAIRALAEGLRHEPAVADRVLELAEAFEYETLLGLLSPGGA